MWTFLSKFSKNRFLRKHVCLRGCTTPAAPTARTYPTAIASASATAAPFPLPLLVPLTAVKQLGLPPLPCQGPLQRYPLRGRARIQTSPAPAIVPCFAAIHAAFHQTSFGFVRCRLPRFCPPLGHLPGCRPLHCVRPPRLLPR